jgi:UDPglucose 6-dehydrogenase
VGDFLAPDRIVLGALDDRTGEVLEELYTAFPGVTMIRTNPRTAEAIKYAANALLATMISFSNEIGSLCAGIEGVDVVDVMRGVHLDRRLSPMLSDGQRIQPAFTSYLEAGCGFGGSCFPKDVKALIAYGRKAGAQMRLLDAVIEINDLQPRMMLTLLEKHFPVLAGVPVTVLGLAFKPGTNDIRESPAIPIVRELRARNAIVCAFDPVAMGEAQRHLGSASPIFATTLQKALEGAQAVLILTRWPEFEELPRLLKDRSDPPVVIDGRRMLDPGSVARYEGIGRGPRDVTGGAAVR